MSDDQFWSIIDGSLMHVEDVTEIDFDRLEAALSRLSLESVLGFGGALTRALNKSYTANLWGAAFILKGGCSDDAFDYFRAWLISQGRKVFEQMVANPDALAAYLEPLDECFLENEDLLAAALVEYQRRTGSYNGYVTDHVWDDTTMGEEWDYEDDDEAERRLPDVFDLGCVE
jgi:Protein of unknown function (DUF4240)